MTTAIDHRNFILNMSLSDGQAMAANSGHATPDEQGRYLEGLDVLRRWAVLNASGAMDVVAESAGWMTTLLRQPDWTADNLQAAYSSFLSFAASTLFRLQDEGLIMFAHEPAVILAEYDPETDVATAIDPLEYTYKAEIGHLDFEPTFHIYEEDDVD